MILPSDEQIYLELATLSVLLYEGIDRDGDLGPTREEYDHHRNPNFVRSASLLSVFGLPVNKVGWKRLVEAYGYLCPSLSDVRKADHQRRREAKSPFRLQVEVDDYPVLQGATREEVYLYQATDGSIRKVTRTITSIR